MPFGIDDAVAAAEIAKGVIGAFDVVKGMVESGTTKVKVPEIENPESKEESWVVQGTNRDGSPARATADVELYMDASAKEVVSKTLNYSIHVRHWGILQTRACVSIAMNATFAPVYYKITNFDEVSEMLENVPSEGEGGHGGLQETYTGFYNNAIGGQHTSKVLHNNSQLWGLQSLDCALMGGSTDRDGAAVSKTNPYRALGDSADATITVKLHPLVGGAPRLTLVADTVLPSTQGFGYRFDDQTYGGQVILDFELVGDAPEVSVARKDKHWGVADA